MLQTRVVYWILFLLIPAFFNSNILLANNSDSAYLNIKHQKYKIPKETNGEDYKDNIKKPGSATVTKTQSDKTESTIFNSWDFENEELGEYTDAEIAQDFNYTLLYSHNNISIVVDTINGVANQVLRINHAANTMENGFEMNVDLVADYNEIYLSYNWKFSDEFNSTTGGKLPGLGGLPDFGAVCPSGGEGFRAHNMFKQAGKIISYHYDRTEHGFPECPWSTTDYDYNTLYFSNGTWYNITQRLVMNTFTEGIANSDGIKELWVDGRMIFQETNLILMEIESNSMKIDAFRLANFYGGSTDDFKPLYECYGYIDNIKVYIPVDDPVSGHGLHSPSQVLETPDEITDRRVYYDSLRTTVGTLRNSEYGSTYSPCIDEAYLIDGGSNNIITYTWNHTIGTGDYLFIYDGNTTDAELLRMVSGYSDQSDQTVTSSGRYLFIRFSTNRSEETVGWTGTISFSNVPENPVGKPNNIIEIFPNPTYGIFNISLDSLEQPEIKIQIRDINGHAILEKQYSDLDTEFNQSIDISGFPAGIYILSVHTAKAVYFERIHKIV